MKVTGLYELDRETLKELYLDALKASFQTWTDEMQEGEISRQRRQKSIWESIEYIIDKPKGRHLTVIYRIDPFGRELDHWEFGTCSTLGKPDYHSWILVSEEEAQKIFKKYKLKIIE